MTQLDEIKSRLDAATPGPWDRSDIGVYSTTVMVGPPGFMQPDMIASECHVADADFIAYARQDIPWLIEQLTESTEHSRLKNEVIAELSAKLEIATQALETILAPFTAHATDEDLGCDTGCYCDQHIAKEALSKIRGEK